MDGNTTIGVTREQRALAVLRVVLGLMILSTFFENLHKGTYTPAGYKGVIDFYINKGSAPGIWKAIESVLSANARIVGPMQGLSELGFGVLLILGFATRVVACAAGAFLLGLWISELGTSWPWELAMYVVVAFTLAWAGGGRVWSVDAVIQRRNPGWRLG